MPQTTHADPITQSETILRRKLGVLFDWEIPIIEKTVGPFDVTPFQEFDRERQNLIDECKTKLRTYSEEKIKILFIGLEDDNQNTLRNWRYFRRDEILELSKRIPPWYAGGFGNPHYKADFVNWSKMNSFSITEMLCLSTGFEPIHFQKKGLDTMIKGGVPLVDGPLRFLLLRYVQLTRRFDPQGFDSRLRPREFLEWVEKVDYQTHAEFLDELSRCHGDVQRSRGTTPSSAKGDRREIEMIAQLFTALAIDHLGYDPSAKRSPIPKEIADIAADLGISVSDDTIRKYLRLGASFIPADWRPKD